MAAYGKKPPQRDGIEFVRRFFDTCSTKRFVRIRHYGISSNHNKGKLIPICRNLIGCRDFLRKFKKSDKIHAIKVLYGKDVISTHAVAET